MFYWISQHSFFFEYVGLILENDKKYPLLVTKQEIMGYAHKNEQDHLLASL